MRLFGQATSREHRDPAPRAAEPQARSPPRRPRRAPTCGPGSDPEPGMQGRNAADAPGREDGFRCNTELVGHAASARRLQGAALRRQGRPRVRLLRHDAAVPDERAQPLADADRRRRARHERPGEARRGPTRSSRRRCRRRTSRSSSTERRGLLAAVTGNPVAYPGLVDIYDVSEDCRHPVLQSSTPTGRFGHESGFAPDGNTFYATSIGDGRRHRARRDRPEGPEGRVERHVPLARPDGQRRRQPPLHRDGRRRVRGRGPDHPRLERDPGPQARPAGARGRPRQVAGDHDPAGRDPGDDRRPAVRRRGRRVLGRRERRGDVARRARRRRADHRHLATRRSRRSSPTCASRSTSPRTARRSPTTRARSSPVQGYAGHYCNVPRRDDPGIVACSFIVSGLRIFDIRDPHHPKELAYFVAPPSEGSSPGSSAATTRCRARTFVPERGEIWYTDGNSGFYNVAPDERRVAVRGGLRRGRARRQRRRRRRGARRVRRLPLGVARRPLGRRPLRLGLRRAARRCR